MHNGVHAGVTYGRTFAHSTIEKLDPCQCNSARTLWVHLTHFVPVENLRQGHVEINAIFGSGDLKGLPASLKRKESFIQIDGR